MPFGGGSKCGLCGKTVYMNEEVKFNSRSWHKLCFKCGGCGKLLEMGQAQEHKDTNYCKSCHSKSFGTSGYGHGVGAGVLSTDNGGGVRAKPAAVTESSAPSSYTAYRTEAAKRSQGAVGAMVAGGSNKCPRCAKSVYHAEKLVALGRDWHKACFRCSDCKKSLEPGNFGDNNGEIFCRGCYGKKFGPKGVGYGQGAGVLST